MFIYFGGLRVSLNMICFKNSLWNILNLTIQNNHFTIQQQFNANSKKKSLIGKQRDSKRSQESLSYFYLTSFPHTPIVSSIWIRVQMEDTINYKL